MKPKITPKHEADEPDSGRPPAFDGLGKINANHALAGEEFAAKVAFAQEFGDFLGLDCRVYIGTDLREGPVAGVACRDGRNYEVGLSSTEAVDPKGLWPEILNKLRAEVRDAMEHSAVPRMDRIMRQKVIRSETLPQIMLPAGPSWVCGHDWKPPMIGQEEMLLHVRTEKAQYVRRYVTVPCEHCEKDAIRRMEEQVAAIESGSKIYYCENCARCHRLPIGECCDLAVQCRLCGETKRCVGSITVQQAMVERHIYVPTLDELNPQGGQL